MADKDKVNPKLVITTNPVEIKQGSDIPVSRPTIIKDTPKPSK